MNDSEKLGVINVTIGGSFIITGTFNSLISERVDQFITRLYNEARNLALSTARDEITLAKVTSTLDKYSRRNILLKRAAGEEVKIDLEKFRLTGDFKLNPYLKNDDVIIFPEYNIETNYVSVEGAVNLPVKFQYCEGDKLSDALLFARGINPAYDDVQEVEISRLDKTGNEEEIIKAGINDVVELKNGDRIRVLSDINNKKDFKVLVLGEVKSPGYIFIKKNQTTVRDVIEKAGGFLADASLENSELIRGSNGQQVMRMKYIKEQFEKNPELKYSKFDTKYNYQNLETLLMSRTSDLTIEDSLALSIDNLLRLMHSPGIVDFTKIDDSSSKEGAFIVKDGDVVLIPEKQDVVFMFGQINSDGYIPYVEGKNIDYYIEKAGGKGDAADGDVKVIRAKSRAWIDADEKTVIAPGDFIYMPKKVSHSWSYYVLQAGSVASVISAISTFIYFLFIAK
jgi:protein involved in polysaccharide export with SLBB domain